MTDISDPRRFIYRDTLDPDTAQRLAAATLGGCDDGELYLQYQASESFGFDDGHIYLTNWWDQRMEWMEFRRGWHGWVPALTGMRDTGLIVNRG